MPTIRIEVIFDTICPWCYVGKRRLETALRQRPQVVPQLVMRPFLLNPDMPPGGQDRSLYLERKFGSRPRVERMLAAVAAAGAAEGIDFDFAAIARTPNTIRSHRLIACAASRGLQWMAAEAVFHAYFAEGRDIGAVGELMRLGGELGLPADELAAALETWPALGAIQAENARAHRLGVNGVPCYIFDGCYAVAGAQDPDVLVRLLDLAVEAKTDLAITAV